MGARRSAISNALFAAGGSARPATTLEDLLNMLAEHGIEVDLR
ncbi:hypothetical protein [Amycolatopsis pittospori]|nr:hypothetical protein [Amycolatopsis pittospori]